MNAEVIRELLRRQPFQPFEIRMSNVESHRIGHPENAFLAGNRFTRRRTAWSFSRRFTRFRSKFYKRLECCRLHRT